MFGARCARPTQLAWATLTGGKRRKEGIWRATLPRVRKPPITLPRDGSGSISLKDFKGRHLVLYFYPKADTAGCTREAIDFSRLRPAFDWTGTDVLGVSPPKIGALRSRYWKLLSLPCLI